jgi:hypothetical protein
MADEPLEPVETPEEHAAAVDATVEDIANSLNLVADPDAKPVIEEAAERDPFSKQPDVSPEAKEAKEAPAKEPEPAAPLETEAAEVDRAPDTWRKEAQEAWKTTPPAVKSELVKREADISRYVGETKKYQEEIAPYITVGAAVNKIIEPYLPLLQQAGVQPATHLERLLYAHATLTFGRPEQKAAMFKQLAIDSGIDLAALANGQGSPEHAMLPAFRSLQQELAQLRQGVTGVTTSFQEAQAAELAQGIVAFANDTENHPFFAAVADQIPAIIDAGQAKTLKDAYDLAVERNPQTRAALRDREYQARRRKEVASQAGHASAARKAMGAKVVSRGTGRAAPALGTVDDTLKEAMAEINSRH